MGNPTPESALPEVRQCTNPDDPEYGSAAVAATWGGNAWLVARPGSGRGGVGAHWAEAGSAEDKAVQQWAAGTFSPYTAPAPAAQEEPK